MPTDALKITIHLVSSLDGYIAKKDNSVSWFETTDKYEAGITVSQEDSNAFLAAIDCYVMGARTYEHALDLSKTYGWPYGEKPTIVLTHRSLPLHGPNIELYSGDLPQLVDERLKPNYSNVWIAGGASLAREFIRLNLADEIRQSILPVMLGEGISFFDSSLSMRALHLRNVSAYKNGMVELHYDILK